MSNDPHTITPAALIRLVSYLGIESDLTDIRSINIEPGKVTVIRYRRNEDGQTIVLPGHNEVATETLTFAVTEK